MNMTTVPSNQLKAMQHEIADLKEQVAQIEFRNERLVADYASAQEEISTIRRIHVHNIAIKDAEIARWKAVPMKYRRMEFNAQLQTENAALKEQVAQLEALAEALKGQETIEQQAEAIEKLRDHIELSLEFCDEEGFCVRDNLENALAIQPSPEILQARDERVAAACAEMLRNKELPFEIDAWVEATKRDVSSMTALALAALVDSGEWRKYL